MRVLRSIFYFSGRAGRTEYWMLLPIFLIGGFYLFIVIVEQPRWAALVSEVSFMAEIMLIGCLYLIVSLPVAALAVRRSRSAGILWVLPLQAVVILIPALIFSIILLAPGGGNPWKGNSYLAIALFILAFVEFVVVAVTCFVGPKNLKNTQMRRPNPQGVT